jgi:type IX secretion system PorP/SprF family membrane protein
MKHTYIIFFIFLAMGITYKGYGQQDPNYTQYMYNTMSVNPAYAGSRDVLSITGLHRSALVGQNGGPTTQTLAIHSPLKNEQIGLGLSIVNDAIGPASETFADFNFAYSIYLSQNGKLSFGMKAGLRQLRLDFSGAESKDANDATFHNLSSFAPTLGSGLYYHNNDFYVGLAVPNFLRSSNYYFIDEAGGVAFDNSFHYYLISGYVMSLTDRLQFKPAVLTKIVAGAPVAFDLSANFQLDQRFVMGTAYRFGDAVSVLAGFQATQKLYAGYAFDYSLNPMRRYNMGGHEFMLRYEFMRPARVQSPRFF